MFNWVNPIRAGVVQRPEDYRWCSLGYHIQTGNKDSLLSVDFGLKEWNELNPREIVRKYRQFVYETGAVDAGPVKCREAALPEAGFNRAGKGAVIDQKIVKKERRRKYKINRLERFRYRSRYFTDAGIIGSPVKSCCACHFVNFTGQARSLWARPQ